MSPSPRPAVVVFVADVPRMSAFYRELASMTVLSGDAQHTVMAIDGLELVVHRLSGEPQVREVRVREDAYVKVCLPVASIAQARAVAAAQWRRHSLS